MVVADGCPIYFVFCAGEQENWATLEGSNWIIVWCKEKVGPAARSETVCPYMLTKTMLMNMRDHMLSITISLRGKNNGSFM